MPEKKTTKKEEIDFADFSIKFTKVCFKVMFIVQRLIYKGIIHLYRKLQIWLAWQQLKADIRDCAECKAYCEDLLAWREQYLKDKQ